jgi:hypothetical protein
MEAGADVATGSVTQAQQRPCGDRRRADADDWLAPLSDCSVGPFPRKSTVQADPGDNRVALAFLVRRNNFR